VVHFAQFPPWEIQQKKIRFENLLNDKQWTPGDFSSSEKSRSNGKGQISL
jgi:hypothetical protein